MFEDMTYDNILEDMLKRVSSDVDKREGSLIYDALAPCAYQLAQTYFLLNNYMDLFFTDTATGDYLDLKAADYGLVRKAATYAVRQIETSGPVDIGTRWGLSGTTYVITQLLSTNAYSATCEQAGTSGNEYSGTLENIDNISGVTATLTNVIAAGTDEESDDELRIRIKEYLTNPSQDGNVAQYKSWATAYDGIAAAKVFPLWNGGNTVKIAITDADYLPANASLVAEFQSYIDPEATGLGNGVAPIGSKVTVSGGTRKDITITANIVLADNYTSAEGTEDAIVSYLASITYVKNSVSYMKIGNALLDCASIVDLSSLKVNGGTSDIALIDDEIPVLASISLAVVTS